MDVDDLVVGGGALDVVEDGVDGPAGVTGGVGDGGDAEGGGLAEVVVGDLGDGDVEFVADAGAEGFDGAALALRSWFSGGGG